MKEKIIKFLKEPILYIIIICIIFQMVIYEHSEKIKIYSDTHTYIEEYTENIFKGEVNSLRTPVYPYFIKIIRTIRRRSKLI